MFWPELHLDVVYILKQVPTMVAHRQVKWAEEVSLLRTQVTHLVVP